jgi:hypothetical protein
MSTTTNYTITPPLSTGQDTSPAGIRAQGVAKSQLQTDLIKSATGGGKRKHKKYYSKGGAIEVNTIPPVYNDTAGGSQSAVNQQVGNQALFAKTMEQKSLDSAASSVPVPASQKGGSTTVLKAGQPWTSCYSGGKKSKKSKKSKKAKKSKKSKKAKKAKKTNKSRKSKK